MGIASLVIALRTARPYDLAVASKGKLMAKKNHVILCVHLTDRIKEAVEVQRTFTSYGGYIKTRLGLHEAAPEGSDVGSKNGLIVLEMVGPESKAKALSKALNKIAGVEVKSLTFTHAD